MESERPIVTITGITGFLGSHVCLTFLKDGGFQVRGTVRDKSNMAKMQPLIDAYGEELYKQIDIREADCLNEESMMKAMEGSTYIVHTAAIGPNMQNQHTFEPKLYPPCVDTALKGTLAACKAAQANKVKKLVITSSLATMQHSDDLDKLSFGPTDWSDVKKLEPYPKSKLIAERAAWDFQKALPEDEQFDLVMINPGVISGETLVPWNISSTSTLIRFMDGEFAQVSGWNFPSVDVKDTALAHLNAIKIQEARNQRFVLVGHNLMQIEYSKCFKKLYPEMHNKPVQVANIKCILGCIGMCTDNRDFKKQSRHWGTLVEWDTSTTQNVLQIKFTPLEQSLKEMGDSMLKFGMVKYPVGKK